MSLTKAAEQYYEGCLHVLADLDELEEGIATLTREPTGVLRFVAHSSAAADFLPALTSTFKRRYPGITLDVTVAERAIDLVADGFDVGLVLPFMLNTETVVTRLVDRLQLVLVASPEYINKHAAITHPAELSTHAFVAFASTSRQTSLTFSGCEGELDVPLTHDIVSNSVVYNLNMVLAGFGLAVLPASMVQCHLRAGQLVRLLEHYTLHDGDAELRLAYSSRAYLPAKVRAFIEHSVEFFSKPDKRVPSDALSSS